MHVPEKWQMDQQQCVDFIEINRFAAIVTDNFDISYAPLTLHPDEDEQGVLYGHIARSNPHWRQLINQRVMCLFQGPHSYISHTYYPKQPNVPTWNYVAVQAIGLCEQLDNNLTAAMMQRLLLQYEPEVTANHPIDAEYIDKLSKAIVGFKIVIHSLKGKQKLGQHRSTQDQVAVSQALAGSQSLDAQALIKYMQAHNVGIG